jgi:hypothetical protein
LAIASEKSLRFHLVAAVAQAFSSYHGNIVTDQAFGKRDFGESKNHRLDQNLHERDKIAPVRAILISPARIPAFKRFMEKNRKERIAAFKQSMDKIGSRWKIMIPNRREICRSIDRSTLF